MATAASITSLTPVPASADEAEAWVRGELIRSLMRSARGSYLVSGTLMVGMAALNWSALPRWEVLTWLTAGLISMACRAWAARVYAVRYVGRSALAQQQYADRYAFVWTASAFVWGLSVLLFFERVPQVNQFISWLVIGILLGGRIGYVLFYQPDMILHPLSIFALWEGGMSFHGGAIGTAIAVWWLARRNDLSFILTITTAHKTY